jgi:hypothetical protein
MSEENIPTTTQAADPVIASTPEPVNESWESQISRQLKSKPKIERTDLKSLEDLPDVATPVATDMDLVSTQETEDFLKQMDGGEVEQTEVKETKKEKKAKQEKAEEPASDSFDISDLDLSKDPEPVAETKTKKSKEENIAELRKKAEAYEESLKTKDTELQSYREKLESLEGELERTAFEKSPKFRELYQAPYAEAVDGAVEFAKEYAGDEAIAEKALSLKGKERIDFIDESFGGGAAAAQFLSLVNNADAKRGALEGALENYKATHQEIINAEQQQQMQTVETINKNFDRVAAHLANKSEFFRMTGDDEHDKSVKARIEAAKNIIHGNASQNEMAVAPFLAVIAKEAVEENSKLKAELAKYKSRAAEDAAVQPRISKGPIDAPENDTIGKPKSALASIRSQLRGI